LRGQLPVACTIAAHRIGRGIRKGEGGAGLDACLELDNSNRLSLCMQNCKKHRGKLSVQFSLHPSTDEKVAPELEKLRNSEYPAKINLYVCLNDICEEREWQFLESGFGDAFFSEMLIDQRRERISSVRVIIPNERMKYEYQGDVDGILRRICRR
jgi:hypothetical protein